MTETVFEPTDKRCPNCHGQLVNEVEIDRDFLGGQTADRTDRGYNCTEPGCGRKFHPHEVPDV
ncbi:hypothetical protein ASG84_01950 [Rhodococcus sp. Leaf278]|uniref:hypothetical protein n=1 Tax=Rhodococcus sp. Leaf278 TaxID=1736319 RepID=UPI000708CC7D|nr:hypothetical protein [Rhodococcus sp. Leaf278]KQU61301.1 hypothetical protein ASG84_01950 [Rhodococcus sp. Leaf278]MBX5331562.1 hypothetical protein [Rhodococcus fascians]